MQTETLIPTRLLYTQSGAMTLALSPLVSETLTSTASRTGDSQVTDGALTEMDEGGRWRGRRMAALPAPVIKEKRCNLPLTDR